MPQFTDLLGCQTIFSRLGANSGYLQAPSKIVATEHGFCSLQINIYLCRLNSFIGKWPCARFNQQWKVSFTKVKKPPAIVNNGNYWKLRLGHEQVRLVAHVWKWEHNADFACMVRECKCFTKSVNHLHSFKGPTPNMVTHMIDDLGKCEYLATFIDFQFFLLVKNVFYR